MSHYVAYLNHPYRRIELDADDHLSARHRAAMLLDTRRADAIELIECPAKHSAEDLIADTEQE